MVEPFFLLDENLSPYFVPAFDSLGFEMRSVVAVFAGRRGVKEEELIPWLGKRCDCCPVWITEDTDSRKRHAKLILEHKVSVLWLVNQGRHPLNGIQELQLLSQVIPVVAKTAAGSARPVYLEASLTSRKAKLRRLQGHLFDRQAKYETVYLD